MVFVTGAPATGRPFFFDILGGTRWRRRLTSTSNWVKPWSGP
jgi:hypothetical protein